MLFKIDDRMKTSENIVEREIEGEFILVPICLRETETEDSLFSLNETGKAIWRKLDGSRTVQQVIDELAEEFQADFQEIKEDVTGIVEEFIKRRMVEIV